MKRNKAATMSKNMDLVCPFCGKKLIDGEPREYETYTDHLFNPNATAYPLRRTWVCDCVKSENLFWDLVGGCYRKGDVALESKI